MYLQNIHIYNMFFRQIDLSIIYFILLYFIIYNNHLLQYVKLFDINDDQTIDWLLRIIIMVKSQII